MQKYIKIIALAAAFLLGVVSGQWLQSRVIAKPVAAVKCPDCNCPAVKPCPPQVDLSKLDFKKKGKNTLNLNLYLLKDTAYAK
jgi:hypothetical protein